MPFSVFRTFVHEIRIHGVRIRDESYYALVPAAPQLTFVLRTDTCKLPGPLSLGRRSAMHRACCFSDVLTYKRAKPRVTWPGWPWRGWAVGRKERVIAKYRGKEREGAMTNKLVLGVMFCSALFLGFALLVSPRGHDLDPRRRQDHTAYALRTS